MDRASNVRAARSIVHFPTIGVLKPMPGRLGTTTWNASSAPQVLRHHGGRIAEENRRRSPVSGSMRRSLTRGAVTSTASALVSTSRGWWQPLRTTSRRPFSSRSATNWAM